MTVEAADTSQYPSLRKAIGSVIHESAYMAIMFQQLGATITGSDLVPFLFEDKTLGAQRAQLWSLVIATNWNPSASHPEIAEDARRTILDILTECQPLIEYRNRVAHDLWEPWPTHQIPDAIEGRRPTRWAKKYVKSSTASLEILATHIGVAASALSTMDDALRTARRNPGETVIGGNMPAHFLQLCAQRKADQIEGWRWIEIPSDYGPKRDNGSGQSSTGADGEKLPRDDARPEP